MRIHLALLGALVVAPLVHADVVLTAKRVAPTSVELDWTAGTPDYGVYRSTLPSGVGSSGNFVALSSGTTYTDGAAAGSALFYLVSESACSADADCPPISNECADEVCSSHACTIVPKPYGYVIPSQIAGDCRVDFCDGAGSISQGTDDSDVPDDHNSCTTDVCQSGTPAFLPLADGHACTDGDGSECESGVCMPTISVVRVGDGTASLGTSATALTIERRKTTGTLISSVALPIAVSGTNQPCTLAGTATSEGSLTRSPNASYVTLAGYAAVPGFLTVASSTTSVVNRVVCRVDAAGNVDSSTRLTSAFNASDVRGAVTNDGTSFWVSGNSTGNLTGGIWYVPFGAAGGTQILASPNTTQSLNIFGGQLYGDSSASPNTDIFTVGSGLPTATGQTATALNGLTTTNTSPEGFAFFDLNPNVAGLDTLYLADERGTFMGGGIQKWTFNGVQWSQVATFTNGLTVGVRGLAAVKLSDGTIALFGTTAGAGDNVVRFIDDFVNTNPAATVLATAPARYAYRGVAISPH